MMRRARGFILFFAVGLVPVWAQKPEAPAADKANAYYNFAMGHLYSELAAAYGNRGEYFGRAIEHYKQAMKLDPAAGFLVEELTDLYVQAGRLRDAVSEAEDILKKQPDNLDARRILGRIYLRLIGDAQQGKINEEILKQAIEQFQKITAKEPKDVESWQILGRLFRISRNSVDSEKAYKKVLETDPSNEDALTGLAMVYADLGDTAKTIEMLRRVTDKNPSARTLAALAGAYEQMRDYANAAEILRRAIELNPGNGQLKRALAQNLLLSERLDEALKLYQELAAEDAKDGQIQLRLAEIYRAKREFAKAHEALAKAKEFDHNSLETRFDEVSLLEAEGKNAEAIAALQAMVDETAKKNYSGSEKGTRVMLLERLGYLLRNGGRFEDAAAAFRKITEMVPQTASRVAVHIVETYRQAKNFTKAREEADRAKAQFPKDRMVILSHASLLADMGQAPEAVKEIRALLNGERDRETHIAIAQLWEKGKNYAEMENSLAAAEKVSASASEKEGIYFMRGAMFEKMKRFDDAEAEFRKVLAASPDNPGALNYLGYMLADRNVRLEEARKLIARAVELDPNNGAYLDSLGWVYYRLNLLPEAETQLIRSLERVGKDPTVHDHLGDVYFKQGKIKEAIAQWQISIKEWESSPQSEMDPAELAKVAKKLEGAKIRVAREATAGAEKPR
jgi:tetratricopeptide (TPR) repeat protein